MMNFIDTEKLSKELTEVIKNHITKELNAKPDEIKKLQHRCNQLTNYINVVCSCVEENCDLIDQLDYRFNEMKEYINEELISEIEKEIKEKIDNTVENGIIKELIKRCDKLEKELNELKGQKPKFKKEEFKHPWESKSDKFDPNISQSVNPRFGGGKQSATRISKRNLGKDVDALNPFDDFSNI